MTSTAPTSLSQQPTEQPTGESDWRDVDLLDDETGTYPTDAALRLIETFPGTPRLLVEDVLRPIFDTYGQVLVDHDVDDLGEGVRIVRLATGGWSGCEEAVAALRDSWFWHAHWATSRRGGSYTFEVAAARWDVPLFIMPTPPRVLDDTRDVGEMMRAFGQTIRSTPTTTITGTERALRVRLVLEEALEFAAAMGCMVTTPGHDVVDKDAVTVEIDPTEEIDLVEATDALGDIIVVTKGSALTLGVPLDEATAVIHATNMAKLGPDGQPIRRPDGKVIKPEGWQPPTVALRDLLVERGWDPESAAERPAASGPETSR